MSGLRLTLLSFTGAAVLLAAAAPAAEVLEDTFDETYPLAANGTINIKNTDGSIRIYAADVAEIHVYAVKRAYTQERLKGIKIEARREGDSLKIETQFPPAASNWSFADRSGTVDYTLVVPLTAQITSCELGAGEILVEGLQGGSVRAHLVNGWLGGHNCFADLDLSIQNGRLDIAYDWWQREKTFTANATTVNGSARVLLPPDASAMIHAQTQNGHVVTNFEEEETNHRQVNRGVTTVIGDSEASGGVQLALRSKNGNIRIDRAY